MSNPVEGSGDALQSVDGLGSTLSAVPVSESPTVRAPDAALAALGKHARQRLGGLFVAGILR